ncbi:ATP-binding domain-containing protein [Rivularia sp. UHCC 0363]|uniref:ATP-binding domain-containing protein n=1 Tax=Rivularia sp. UHCC 0363 TaxID=3110244 RepID=UPI002B1F105F|nr:ATP-binding domain-containing protein [Rivularia sp. UHCC 0363]MEA5596832.1 ATP-binding domain-containing protein [Rivularia sp. UHCC 0363]
MGFITNIDTEEQEVIVNYTARDVTYDYADLNELALAWSVSIHKSQGSEYPVVLLPLYSQHFVFSLQQQLLTTTATTGSLINVFNLMWTYSYIIVITINIHESTERSITKYR